MPDQQTPSCKKVVYVITCPPMVGSRLIHYVKVHIDGPVEVVFIMENEGPNSHVLHETSCHSCEISSCSMSGSLYCTPVADMSKLLSRVTDVSASVTVDVLQYRKLWLLSACAYKCR